MRFIYTVVMLSAMATSAAAAEVEGFLMDRMCSRKAMDGGQKTAAMHTRDCALMPDCISSGYGVYTTDGKYLAFDDAGNSKAAAALKQSDKKDNLRVKVNGKVDGDHIAVSRVDLL